MERSRGPPVALPTTSTESQCATRLSTFQSHSQSSCLPIPTISGMAIPGTRVNDIPPALPPPRYNNDLEIGFDLAWKWQNEHFPFMRRTLAPIKPDSSLWGGIPHAQRTMDDDEDVEMMDHDSSLHAQPIPRLQPQSQLITGTLPTLIRRPPSSTGINQR